MIRLLSNAIAFTFLMLSVNSYASTVPGTYLSLDLGSSLLGEAYTDNSSGKDLSGNLGASSASIALGYRFESNNRVQISRSVVNVNYESGFDSELTGTDLEWHIAYGNDGIHPYWGFGLGVYTLEDTADIFVNGNDVQGRTFQVLTGLKFDVSKHFELDLSYRVKNINWQEMVFINQEGVEKVRLSHIFGNLNMGAAIKF
jgi:opacity protein-like surface antigen